MGYTLMDLIRKGLSGRLTQEEHNYYLEHFMSSEEKQIGKPFFKMTETEELEYDRLCFNNKQGELTGYDCPICKNKGEIMVVKDGYSYYPECSCMQIRRSIENMQRSGLGELLNQKKFSNYNQTEEWQKDVVNKAKRFIESDGNCFIFCGQSGIGKTHICTAISRALLNKGIPLKYMLWVDESKKIKQAIKDEVKYAGLVDELKNVQALYIDDFFKNKPSDADKSLAIEIINYRYNLAQTSKNRYVTIISTELSIKQLNDLDNALCGRLCEMAGKDFILQDFGEEKNYRLKTVMGERK